LPGLAQLLAPYARVDAWFGRMRGFGHGTRDEITSSDALRLAADGPATTPAPFDAAGSGFERGEPVSVAALDYGTDPVAGTLAMLSADEVALQRDDERAGRVVVHFPRIGFQLRHQEKLQ
jgi:hypothetical protein